MAKENNLKDLLTDVADAIREKKGTTELINPQDFGEEIRGIESREENNLNISFSVIDNTIVDTTNYSAFVIKEGVKQVALYNTRFSKVVNVTLPSTLEQLNNSCFQSFSELTTVELPEKVVHIGSNAFHSCIKLSSITIPRNVKIISQPCFGMCVSLAEIVVDVNNTTYDSRENCNAIIQTSTNTLVEGGIASTIPNGITTIGVYAFRGRGPERLVFPKSITKIETNAFNYNTQTLIYDFSNLEAIPTLVKADAFTATSASSQIIVPNGLYDEWVKATNWSTYANRIIKAE